MPLCPISAGVRLTGIIERQFSPSLIHKETSEMSKAAVNPPELMKPVGFAHGYEVRGGRLLFLAGQVAFDKEGNIVGRGDILAQFKQVCENLKTVVTAQGGTMQDIVKLNIFTTHRDLYMDSRPALGQIY